MERLYTCCAGLDVHKQSVVACLLHPDSGAERKEIRTFGTTTAALEDLRDWLSAAGRTHVAMEATGVYTPLTTLLTRCAGGSMWL